MSDSDGSDYVPTEDEADAGDDGSNEEIRDEDYFDDAAAASSHEEGHWFTLFNVEHCRVLAEPASGEEGSDAADSDSGAAHDDDGASLSTVHDADRESCILACRRPRMDLGLKRRMLGTVRTWTAIRRCYLIAFLWKHSVGL